MPATIGALVERSADGVRIVAVNPSGSAARAGLRPGDVVLRYNDTALADERQFNALVLDSRPGEVAHVQAMRGGKRFSAELTVQELDTMPRF